jgi:cell division protein FtsB
MKKVIFFITLGICILVINNLVRSIYTLWHKNDLVVDAQRELTKQKQENQKLKSQLSYVESKEFVEEVARNKLFLVKPGEQAVLIPQDLNKGTSTPSANIRKQDPNWKKWLKLFF